MLSKRFSSSEIEKEVETFFNGQRDRLAQMSPEEVRSRCEAIIKTIMDPPTTYLEEASDYWEALTWGMPFDWRMQVVKELENITNKDMWDAANEWIFDPASRRSISVMLFGKDHLKHLQAMKEEDEDAKTKGSSSSTFLNTPNHSKLWSLDEWGSAKTALPRSNDIA